MGVSVSVRVCQCGVSVSMWGVSMSGECVSVGVCVSVEVRMSVWG